ncbi:MAG: hypothetical protein OHK0029_24420 [Armatimonadaceae bacterium]
MNIALTAEEVAAGELSPERLQEALQIFADTGIVIIENVYDAEFIQRVRAAYDVELDRYLEIRGGLEALEGKTFGKNHIGFFPPLFDPIADEKLAAHPIAVQLMEQILGSDLQCSFYHTNTACPGSGIQPVHRDSGHLYTGAAVPHTHNLVLNVPLCDFTEENGSTEYWPASHLIPDADAAATKNYENRAKHLPSIRLNMKAGSLALRDLRAWHRGMPNNADYSRTMFAIVYQRSFLNYKAITIPQTTWDSWGEKAQHIFRRNRVVPDDDHRAMTWEEMRG